MPTDISAPPRLPPFDANGDGAATLADAEIWLQHVYFLPGDWLLWLLSAHLPSVAGLFGVGSSPAYGGLASGLVSGFAWLAIAVALIIGCTAVRDLDRRLTRAVSGSCEDVLRRARIAIAVFRSRLRRRKQGAVSQGALAENLTLTSEELKLLQAHLELPPGYALHVSDGARELGIRSHQAVTVFEKLAVLGLLTRTLGGDGEAAYTLSAAGRGYLVFQQLAERS